MSAGRKQAWAGEALGHPRVHLRETCSTNSYAKELARAGAPHGTLVTAEHQSAGRGRQGRSWWAPPGSALLCSLILRAERAAEAHLPGAPPGACEQRLELLPILVATALARALGAKAQIKWPNDLLFPRPDGRLGKVAGILIERSVAERFAVVGIGVNVCARIEDAPPQLREAIATLGADASAIEPLLERVVCALRKQLSAPPERVIAQFRARDALFGRAIEWTTLPTADAPPATCGRARGIDERGRLLVASTEGLLALVAGEVHLREGARAQSRKERWTSAPGCAG
jgi:BirA family biotin operon repressor/biotin-[acetyl-CoA-carboxylase] ligase